MKFDFERDISIVSLIALLFLATNFSPQLLGIIYALMIIFYLLAVEFKGVPEFKIGRGVFRLDKIVMIAVGGLVAWFFISMIVLNFGFGLPFSVESFMSVVSTQTTLPYITGNPFLMFIVFVLIVGVAESVFFFGVVQPWLTNKLKLNMADKKNWIIIAIVMASIFSIFHLSAHVFEDMALVVDGVFGGITALMVINYKELKQAIIFHMGANFVVLISMGVLFAAALV